MGDFTELRVWKDSMDLAEGIYKITTKGKFAKDFGLRGQIQRAGVSVPSNIAEGDERDSNREAIRFFHIAKGSVSEVITQVTLAYRIGYIDEITHTKFINQSQKIRASLKNLIKARKAKGD